MASELQNLTADHTNSTTTKTSMTDLDTTLLANTTYAFEFVLRSSANAATVGVQLALRFSGTVTRLDAAMSYWASATAPAIDMPITGATSSPQNLNATTSHGNTVAIIRVVGLIEVGASGGTFGMDHG
jgi:hypothetical protein